MDFKSNYISKGSIDLFYKKYKAEQNKFESIYINFFWWEPLLNFDMVTYCVNKFWKEPKIKFSLWTNGLLLNKEKLEFCLKNNVEIHLSLDYDNVDSILSNELILAYKNIIHINFILQPRKIFLLQDKLDAALKVGFINFNIMPVYTTRLWTLKELDELKTIYLWIMCTFENQRINFFTYFKWPTSELQFMLDTDWSLYRDIDSLLWLQKQYSIIPKSLKDLIHRVSYSWNINGNFSLSEVCDNYQSNNIERVIESIPKITNNEEINSRIEQIFTSN